MGLMGSRHEDAVCAAIFGGCSPLAPLADGLSLTRLAAETSRGVMVDPLFNFACIWALPFRDNTGVVRVPLPPHAPIGIVHLSMWAGRHRFYFEHRLLFQEGRYLTDEERNSLLS